MQHLGNIDNKETAYIQAEKLAKEKNKTIVIEKAKRKEGVHKYTTYRGWLISSSTVAKVITMEEWRLLPSEQQH
jgi:ribosomal protein L21